MGAELLAIEDRDFPGIKQPLDGAASCQSLPTDSDNL